jgi:hypothetical protein
LQVGADVVPQGGECHAYCGGVGVSRIFQGYADAILEGEFYGISGALLGEGSGKAEEKEDNIYWSPVHVAKPHKFVKF